MRVLECIKVSSKQLISIFKTLVGNLKILSKFGAKEVNAFCSCVWSWIFNYPDEFSRLYGSTQTIIASKLLGIPNSIEIYENMVNQIKSKDQRYVLLPFETMLLLLNPEKLKHKDDAMGTLVMQELDRVVQSKKKDAVVNSCKSLVYCLIAAKFVGNNFSPNAQAIVKLFDAKFEEWMIANESYILGAEHGFSCYVMFLVARCLKDASKMNTVLQLTDSPSRNYGELLFFFIVISLHKMHLLFVDK